MKISALTVKKHFFPGCPFQRRRSKGRRPAPVEMGHLLGARAWVAEPSPGTATWEEVASGLARAAGKAEGQEGSLGGGGAGAQPASSGLPRCPGRRLEQRGRQVRAPF